MFSATPKSLVVYSSPESLGRLRIDKEHRAIDSVLAKHHLGADVVHRIQAATLMDLAVALREEDYEVVVFSGHGDEQGLYFEADQGETHVGWDRLAQILKDAVPRLSVVIANSCFSSAGESLLLSATPRLITMIGEIGDEAAIAFSTYFFDEYYRSTSVEQAFRFALHAAKMEEYADALKPHLTCRHKVGQSVVQACFSRRHDSIFIDISGAEESIASLPVSRQEFLSLLTRKIRFHEWIFRVPRERAVLQIGRFFGVFSWENANDIVRCHEVLQLRRDISEEDCVEWTHLLVAYNDLRSERYRMLPNPAADENRGVLLRALQNVSRCAQHMSSGTADVARKHAPSQYTVTCSTVRVHSDRARDSLEQGLLSEVVVSLEMAITAIHDLLDALTEKITVSSSPGK